MWAFKRSFVVCCLFPLLAPSAAHAGLIGRSTEISIGREAAQQFERQAVVDNDPVAVAKIRRIGRRLVSVCNAPDYPFEFHYVDAEEVNAFAMPGGYVYIYRGLLQLLPNDDSLAFILGHEISHVVRRHGVDQIEKSVVTSVALDALLGRNGASQILQALVSLHYSRSDESEADDLGLRTMVRAGFNPEASVQVMEILRRAAGDGKGVPKLLRDHPAPADRLRSMREQAAELRKQQLAEKAKQPQVAVAPPAEAPPIPGLEAVRLAPCELWPLKTGMRWSYRVKGPDGAAKTTWSVLEQMPGKPEGVYRMEVDYGAGVRSVQLLAPAGDRLLKHPTTSAAAEWQVMAVFATSDATAPAEGFRIAGEEAVQVPAGDFQALKVEKIAADGTVAATTWFAKGVGMVKRVAAGSGITEELEFYQTPR